MKTEDWLRYERERDHIHRVFRQAPIVLVFPLEADGGEARRPNPLPPSSDLGQWPGASGQGEIEFR